MDLHAYDFFNKRFCNKKGVLYVPDLAYWSSSDPNGAYNEIKSKII